MFKEESGIREEILQSVKNVCDIDDSRYDEFIEYYYNVGKVQVEGYVESSKLTSTLYLLIHKFVIFKVKQGIERETTSVLKEDYMTSCCGGLKEIYKLDKFFMDYLKLLTHYKRLQKIEI